jgi:predicted O-methyltransferase YrrM
VAGGERSADDIQREIEKSRAALAETVDELAYRTNPKRAVDTVKQTLRQKAQSTQGRIVIGVAGGLVVLLVIRRIAKH